MKRRKVRCPHPYCIGGFVYETQTVERDGRVVGEVTLRRLCPICNGIGQIRATKHQAN